MKLYGEEFHICIIAIYEFIHIHIFNTHILGDSHGIERKTYNMHSCTYSR